MEVELSSGRALSSWTKRKISSVVLYVLYGGLYELYRTDSRVKEEMDRWPDGMTYGLKCSKLSMRLRGNSAKKAVIV